MPASPTVGFIGLGIMGKPMAQRLLAAGIELVVHSRSPEPVRQLVAAGARPAATSAELAADADVVITMLPDTPDVESVLLGGAGVVAGLREGSLVVDMSTIDPLVTRRLAAEVGAKGASMLDAPVSGGERGAIEGTLSIMVGGPDTDVARAMPLLEVMGGTIVHVGSIGAGQVAKACNQLVVASGIQAVAEALALAERAGVDARRVREGLLGGFAGSKILEIHGKRMLEEEFTPGFRARLHLKDARIVARLAEDVGAKVPAFTVAAESLRALVEEDGAGDLDHSALYLLVAPDGSRP